jgi:sugar/nucleoside kinase (ribokinase family)/class 3 adenylate cyclase
MTTDRSDFRSNKTVVSVDLVAYSTICANLEEGLNVTSVAQLDQQIQSLFIDVGLSAIGASRCETVAKSTGDGAILVFNSAEHAHRFADALHAASRDHNRVRREPLAKRVFRIGAATGDIVCVLTSGGGFEFSGMTFSRATRLEANAIPGGLLVDEATYQCLPTALKKVYGPQTNVTGKRTEVFTGYSCRLNLDGIKDAQFFETLGGQGKVTSGSANFFGDLRTGFREDDSAPQMPLGRKELRDAPPPQSEIWISLEEFAGKMQFRAVDVRPPTGTTRVWESNSAFTQIVAQANSCRNAERDVFVVSAHNVDEVIVVDRIDADHECEALKPPCTAPGGSGANTGYILARLGASTCVSGIVGAGRYGDMLLNDLKDAQVDLRLLLRSEEQRTGSTITLVEETGGKRLIVVKPGINNHFASKVDREEMLRAALSSRIVHLSSFVGAAEFQLQEQLVRRIGLEALISLTPGALYSRQGLDRLQPILKYVDVMFLYREQLVELIRNSAIGAGVEGKSTNELLAMFFSWRHRHGFETPAIVVVKDSLSSPDGHIQERFLSVGVGRGSLESAFTPGPIPAGVHVKAVDGTGAGDAAAAGFILGMLRAAPLQRCIDFAFLLGSFASTELGARTAFRSRAVNVDSLGELRDGGC